MNNLFTHTQFINTKLPENFFLGLTELFLELGIDGHDFIDDFTRYYLLQASNAFDKRTDIYNSTGFSEYTAKKYLTNSQYASHPKRRKHYRSLIIEIKELCEKSKDGSIPIYGKSSSYNAAFAKSNATDNTITASSTLKKLIKAGCVTKIDNENIKFITTLQTNGSNSKKDTLRLLANLVNRVSGTFLHNLLAKNNDNTLFQMSYFSKTVHPDNKKKLTDELREEQRKDFRKYQKIIDSYEEKGYKQKQMEYLNEEVGVTSLIFRTKNTSLKR